MFKPRTLALASILALAVPTAGCASMFAGLSVAQEVLAIVTDGQLVLSAIKSFVTTYFTTAPNATLQAQITNALDTANSALDAALRSTQGVEDLSQDQVDAAFASFKTAYTDLLALVQPLGVQVSSTPALKATYSSTGHGTLTVPKPLAFTGGK